MTQQRKRISVRTIAATAVLSALSCILMYLEFSVPLVPSFLKFDFSDLPALIASFGFGPVAGVVVALMKNVIHLPMTTTGGVGELSNFLLGCLFVIPAGWIYRIRHNRKMALIGAVIGSLAMALGSLPLNYYVTYPTYAKFLPIDKIVAMYQAIFPGVDGLFQCLLIFNVPYTFLKGMVNTVLTFLIYKHISRLIKGNAK